MRPSCLTTLLVALALPAMPGCRQPTGSTVGTSVSPLTAPGGTNPSVGGTGIGPFGGSTRVRPPGTGSYGTANNYLGGVAPVSASVTPQRSNGQLAATSLGDDRYGERQLRETQVSGPPSGNYAAADSLGIRLGGMPVNDLTQAPTPPGYRPTGPTGPNVNGYPGQHMPAGRGVAAGGTPIAPVSHQATSAPARSGTEPRRFRQPSLQPAPSPPQLSEVSRQGIGRASAVATTGTAADSKSSQRGSTSSGSGYRSELPSTDPISGGGNSSGSETADRPRLPWRMPSPRY